VKPPSVGIHPIIVLLYLVAKLLLSVPSPTLSRTLLLSGMCAELLDRRHPILSLHMGVVQALDHPSLEARGPRAGRPFLNVEGSSPQWTELVKEGGTTHVRGGSPAAMVIMVIRRVLVEEFLCRD
jgi:hypothetical protein